MFRRPLILVALLVAGCESAPGTPDNPFAAFPDVRNHRPNISQNKATMQVQAETFYLRLDADLSEAWSLVSLDGLDGHAVLLWRDNGIKLGTMDAVALSQFMAKLPPTGGSKRLNIGAGNETVIIETTPMLDRGVDIDVMLGPDRDESIRLPVGRMQLLMDISLSREAVKAEIKPHHHWVSTSVTPRTPQEKAVEGRVFRELATDVDLTGDRYLVLALLAPPKKEEEKPAPKPAAEIVDVPAPRTTVNAQVEVDPEVPRPPVRPPVRIVNPSVIPASKPKLGDALLTGTRAGKNFQLVVVIRIPPQGDALPVTPDRPE